MQGAIGKRKEFERLASEGKVSAAESEEICTRTDTLSYAMLAEISTFHQTKSRDVKLAHQHFLQEQISFYQKVWIICLLLYFLDKKDTTFYFR